MFVYTHALKLAMDGTLDLTDVRVLLVMSNTTADTERDVSTLGDLTTLDEYDGSNYSAGGVALTGEATSQDDANNRAVLDAADASWTSLGAGTRSCVGAVVYAWGGSVGASVPLCFHDQGGFPFAGNGANVQITWNASGIFGITAP